MSLYFPPSQKYRAKNLLKTLGHAIWKTSAFVVLVTGTSFYLHAAKIPQHIKSIIKERVDFGLSKGIVVGITDKHHSDFYGYGLTSQDGMTPDQYSVFEIGSITKLFTSTLLADAVNREEVAYQDVLGDYLPNAVISDAVANISLEMLSTHYSGLPRNASNFEPQYYKRDPKKYTTAELYAYLGQSKLISKPGSQYLYSNLAVGLLGHILELNTGQKFADLLLQRITKKLAMSNTAIGIGNIESSLATSGHHGLIKVAPYPADALQGAGAMVSNAEDMVKFLQSHLEDNETKISKALQHTRSKRAKAWKNTAVGLGWFIDSSSQGNAIHWHNGSTGGYHSFIGLNRENEKGVIILANSGGDGNDDIGFNLLDSSFPIKVTPKVKEIEINSSLLTGYVGRYQTSFGMILEVTLQNNHLQAKLGEQFPLRLYPKSKTSFFYRAINASISFETDKTGNQHLILHQDGENYSAHKL